MHKGCFFSTSSPKLVIYHLIICCYQVNKSCLTLWDSMDCSTSSIPVLQYYLELAQTHVCWAGNAIQSSHPLSPSSPSAFNLSQRSFRSFSNESAFCIRLPSVSASVLPKSIQGWFPLGLIGWSPCFPRNSQESSSSSQFKNVNSLVLSLLYGPTVTSVHDCWKD